MILGSYLRGCLWRVGRSKKTEKVGAYLCFVCVSYFFVAHHLSLNTDASYCCFVRMKE